MIPARPEVRDIKERAIQSMKWSAFTQIISRIATPLVFVVLARILQRDDYGLMSVALIVVSFSQIFVDAGLGKTLIQTDAPLEKCADIVFWSNLCVGTAIYAVLFAGAPWLAVFFRSSEAAPVIRVLGITVVFTCLTTVQQSLLTRELGFRPLFWVKLVSGFAPGIFSIALALRGFGVWALVAGNLAGSLLNCVLLWVVSDWRPRMSFDVVLARSLFGFGGWVLAESFAGWFFAWGDNLLVGKYLGINDLGVYQVAWNTNTLLFSTLIGAFTAVLYPTFARLRQDRQGLIDLFHKSSRILMAITLPMGVGLLLVGGLVESVIFGSHWAGLGLILGLVAVLNGFFGVVAFNAELYRAMGRPDINSKLLGVFILYYFPAYVIAAPYGLVVFATVRVAVSLLTIPIHAVVCSRLLHISAAYVWTDGKKILGAVLVMAAGTLGAQGILDRAGVAGPLALAVTLFAGAIIYGVALFLLDRRFLVQNWGLLNGFAGIRGKGADAGVVQ